MMDSSLAWPLTMEKCAEERQKSQGKHENAPIVAPAVSRSPKKAPRERSLQIDQKTEKKVKQVSDKVSECLQIVANEPSLGLFRLQEHVRRSILTLVTLKKDVNHVKQKVQGLVYDAEYGLKTLESMQGIESFSATRKHLKKHICHLVRAVLLSVKFKNVWLFVRHTSCGNWSCRRSCCWLKYWFFANERNGALCVGSGSAVSSFSQIQV
eukprot:m.261773 g.261773  ORF g.261773 m.261773 type:complete len:210 (+) comp40449_c1_seq4:32-661(+)